MKGICQICGCTEDNACSHPELGNCYWVDEDQDMCSHCFELNNDPQVERPYSGFAPLINQVQFQLDNIKGWLSIKDKESAAIKSGCLTKAAKELEESLKKLQ